uniref:7TM_GPCR_Srx domain-containing protein n=1 Tax=Steinernema glaseri TaxID=37863 RepID=A0A1I8A219_9BILA
MDPFAQNKYDNFNNCSMFASADWNSLGVRLWAAQCMTVLILAVNRCVEFWKIEFLASLFEGYKMAFWYILVITYFLVFFIFSPCCLYNTVAYMWMTDPYVDKPDRSWYADLKLLKVNNIGIFIGLCSCYLFLSFSICYQRRKTGSVTLSKIQKQVSIQSCVLCSFICFTGGSYVFFGIFPELGSPVMATVNFVLWQWTFCGAVICYMVMNKTLRQGVIKFYFRLFRRPSPKRMTVRPIGDSEHRTSGFQ